jgi:hypothetical protein
MIEHYQGRLVKLRNVHSRYTRSRKDGLRYRGPKGVSTRSTPSSSLSIHIRAALFTDKKIVGSTSVARDAIIAPSPVQPILNFKCSVNRGRDGFPCFHGLPGKRAAVCKSFDRNGKKLCKVGNRD